VAHQQDVEPAQGQAASLPAPIRLQKCCTWVSRRLLSSPAIGHGADIRSGQTHREVGTQSHGPRGRWPGRRIAQHTRWDGLLPTGLHRPDFHALPRAEHRSAPVRGHERGDRTRREEGGGPSVTVRPTVPAARPIVRRVTVLGSPSTAPVASYCRLIDSTLSGA
jgi:hypothetical protein